MMKNISNERVIKITFIISLTVHCLFLSIPGFNSKKFQNKRSKEMFVQIEIKKPSPLPETEIISKKKKEIKKLIKPAPEHKPKEEKVIKQKVLKVKKIEKKIKPIEEEIVKPEIQPEQTENIEEKKPVRQDSDIELKEEEIVKPEIQPKGLTENIKEKQPTKEEQPTKEVSYGDGKNINLKEELMLNYQKAVKEKIEDCRRYPYWARKQGFEGTVHLKFTILSTGGVKDIKIIKSSGFNILDKEAISTVKRASPFPPIPEKINRSTLTIEVSLVFQLK